MKRKLLQEKGKEKQGNRNDLLSNNDKKLTDNHNTREETSKELGWSTGKVAQAEQVWEKGDEQVKQKVKNGETSQKIDSSNRKSKGQNDTLKPTAEKIAEKVGVSDRTIKRYARG